MALSDKLEAKLDELAAYPAADEVKYVPKTEFDWNAGTGSIQTGPLKEPPTDYTALLEQFGYDPAKVRIVGHPRVSKWEQRSRIRGTAEYETCWLSAFKFQIAAVDAVQSTDLDSIVKKARKTPKPGTGPHWMVFQAGDLQLGKRASGGGTAEILDRYFESVQAAVDEFKSLKRHGIEGIQISMPGDCTEGWFSQASKNIFLTDSTITEQVRILRRVMLHTIEAFSPLVDQVTLDVVNGNHDDSQRAQNTYAGDGWATEAATAVADALTMNPASFGHVTVRVPDKWCGSMTVPVGDTVITIIHGHQFRPNQGMKWWSEQALNNQPAGAAHILQQGHYHSWQVETTEHRTRIQSSTFDTGSEWYRDKRGATARRGGLVYLVNAGQVSRMSLV